MIECCADGLRCVQERPASAARHRSRRYKSIPAKTSSPAERLTTWNGLGEQRTRREDGSQKQSGWRGESGVEDDEERGRDEV
jgi:hypothetical protein